MHARTAHTEPVPLLASVPRDVHWHVRGICTPGNALTCLASSVMRSTTMAAPRGECGLQLRQAPCCPLSDMLSSWSTPQCLGSANHSYLEAARRRAAALRSGRAPPGAGASQPGSSGVGRTICRAIQASEASLSAITTHQARCKRLVRHFPSRAALAARVGPPHRHAYNSLVSLWRQILAPCKPTERRGRPPLTGLTTTTASCRQERHPGCRNLLR